VDFVPWRTRIDGNQYALTIIRSPWDYQNTPHEFPAQPFLPFIVEEGEFSMMYFFDDPSHSIWKRPKFGDFRVQ